MKNGNGYLYFYVHFIVEVVCFYYLSKVTNNSTFVWLIPFLYDGLAFVPQSFIGYINDKHPKINMGYIGVALLFIAILIFSVSKASIFISLIILCFGNACLHIDGAENTIRNSNGKLSPSALFVSGGSFGVITGRILAGSSFETIYLLPIILTIIPFIMLAKTTSNKANDSEKFNYVKGNINPFIIVVIAVFVVIIRGYVGYGIPTSWNKTTLQTICLFFTMGIGKALGGILSDKFGIRKVAILSTILAIPFLCFGDNLMLVSLIGVMFFSMTMSITLAILVSILKKTPGLAFGLTTIGLFLGTVPIFFIKLSSLYNIVLIIVASLLCSFILGKVLKGDRDG